MFTLSTYSLYRGLWKTSRHYYSTVASSEVLLEALTGEDTGIFVISLNRPSVKNAIDRNTIKTFSETLDALSCNKEARVLIIRSMVRKVFSSGADLKERVKLTEFETKNMVNKFRSLTNQIESHAIPVIAALDGVALGGGFEIALACDIRIASSDSMFGLVETKLAIIPGAGGTQRLPRIVGPSIAKELIFTGKIISGDQAKAYQIVNHLVPQNDSGTAAYEEALKLCRDILPNGPLGIKMAKSAINKGLQVDVNTGCAIEESCYAQVIPSKDRLEGLYAFLDRRTPKYLGE